MLEKHSVPQVLSCYSLFLSVQSSNSDNVGGLFLPCGWNTEKSRGGDIRGGFSCSPHHLGRCWFLLLQSRCFRGWVGSDLMANFMGSYHRPWPRCQPGGLTFPISRETGRFSTAVTKWPRDTDAKREDIQMV